MTVSPFLLVGVPLSLAAVALVIVCAVSLLRRRGRAAAPEPTAVATFAAATKHGNLTNAVAWVAAVIVGLVLFGALNAIAAASVVLGALVPVAVGLVLLAIYATGEVTWPRPTGAVRIADLTPRTVGDVAHRATRLALWATVALGALLLMVFGLLADDSGTGIERTWPEGIRADGLIGLRASPFPGFPYGIALLLGWLVLLAGAEWLVHHIARRPAVDGTAPAADLALRRVSARRVLRSIHLVMTGHVVVVLFVAGSAFRGVGYHGPAGITGIVGAVLVVGTLALAVARDNGTAVLDEARPQAPTPHGSTTEGPGAGAQVRA